MESWPTEALQNVADARAMCAGGFVIGDAGCLLTVAFGSCYGAITELGCATVHSLMFRFDGLVMGGRKQDSQDKFFTVRHVVPVDTLRIMCANRARRILARRHLASLPPVPSPVATVQPLGSAEGAVRA